MHEAFFSRFQGNRHGITGGDDLNGCTLHPERPKKTIAHRRQAHPIALIRCLSPMAIEHKKIRNDERYLCQQNDVMKTSNQVVSLGTLEADLGLSRVDLLLVMRELGLEPVKRGMRTWINQDEANSLYKHFGKSNPREPLIAEVVPENDREDRQLAPTGTAGPDNEDDLKKYSKLRLLRERIEVLELLSNSNIELSSHEISTLLDLKRLPTLQMFSDETQGFQRMGLDFIRIRREGHRTSWKVRTTSNHVRNGS